MLRTRASGRPSRNRRQAFRGQNLVELGLTLPFVLIFLFFIIELGRAWFVYEGAKMAATAGAHAAATYHNKDVGQNELDKKIAAAGLEKKTTKVDQIQNQHAYYADVTVTFKPFFGGVSIPTVSGNIQLIPSQFDISYTAVEDVSVY